MPIMIIYAIILLASIKNNSQKKIMDDQLNSIAI